MSIFTLILCAMGGTSVGIFLWIAWSFARFVLGPPPILMEFTIEAPTVPLTFRPAKQRRRRRRSITPDRMIRAIHLQEQAEAGHWVESPDQGGK